MNQYTKFSVVLLLLSATTFTSCKKEKHPVLTISYPIPNPNIGELIQIGALSINRSSFVAAAVGSKILFAGGSDYLDFSKVHSRIDIFDTVSGQWSRAELSEARTGLAAVVVGNKVIFAGGIKSIDTSAQTFEVTSRADIYDVSNNSWTTSEMPEATYFGYTSSAIAAGSLGFFCPGDSSKVFVFNATTGSWTTMHISEPRIGGVVVSDLDEHVYFAGGFNTNQLSWSKRVDIYNANSNQWSTDSLSEARSLLKATSVHSKIVFAGGQITPGEFTDKVDIFDKALPGWKVSHLVRAYSPREAITSGEKAVFFDNMEPKVEIYNASSDTWSTVELYRKATNPDPAPYTAVAVVLGDKTYIAGFLPDGYPGIWVTRF